MKYFLGVLWWGCKESRRLQYGVGFIALVAAAGVTLAQEGALPVISQAEIDEMERGIDQMEKDREVVSKNGISLVCDDDSCRGYYEHIVSNMVLYDSGQILVFVTPEVTPFLAASSHACARESYVVLQFGNASELKREAAHRILNQLQVARAMGYEIEVEWTQSNYSPSWLACNVGRLFVYGPPAP